MYHVSTRQAQTSYQGRPSLSISTSMYGIASGKIVEASRSNDTWLMWWVALPVVLWIPCGVSPPLTKRNDRVAKVFEHRGSHYISGLGLRYIFRSTFQLLIGRYSLLLPLDAFPRFAPSIPPFHCSSRLNFHSRFLFCDQHYYSLCNPNLISWPPNIQERQRPIYTLSN